MMITWCISIAVMATSCFVASAGLQRAHSPRARGALAHDECLDIGLATLGNSFSFHNFEVLLAADMCT